MKKILIVLLCAMAVLLSACAIKEPTQAELEIAEGNYASIVFDTAADANKLTARYLYLTKNHKITNDNITTGDSTVYTSPEGKIMLVDCGNLYAGEEVVEQLKKMGVEKIDVFVLSHPHADHIGGFEPIVSNFPVEQIYMNDSQYDTAISRRVQELINEKNIPYTYLYDGDSFDFGAQVRVGVYGPEKGDTEQIKAGFMDENNCSLALRLVYNNSSFWTGGDMYTPQEQALIEKYGDEINSDVMKMNHHGWDTSSCKDFVDAMSPLVAVAMHDSITSRTVAMRFSTRGAQTFYNCADGAVRVSTPGDGTYDVQSQFIREFDFYGEPSSDGHYALPAV